MSAGGMRCDHALADNGGSCEHHLGGTDALTAACACVQDVNTRPEHGSNQMFNDTVSMMSVLHEPPVRHQDTCAGGWGVPTGVGAERDGEIVPSLELGEFCSQVSASLGPILRGAGANEF